MSRTITSSNHGARSAGKKRPAPAKPPVVSKVPEHLAPETAIVQKVEMPITLRLKFGSIIVHVEEMLSPGGHPFDAGALAGLIQDPEIRLFMEETGKMGILPVKR